MVSEAELLMLSRSSPGAASSSDPVRLGSSQMRLADVEPLPPRS